MAVDFVRPLVLAALLVLPVFWYYYLRRYPKSYLIVRSIVLTVLIIALAGPQLALPVDEREVLFLVDRSHSVSEDEQERALSFIQEALQYRDDSDSYGVASFGADFALDHPVGSQDAFPGFQEQPSGRYTDIEKALRQGRSLLPEGNRRVVLLSDGWETAGQAADEIDAYRERDIPIDIYPLQLPVWEEEVLVTDVLLPDSAAEGESFVGRVIVYSASDTEGTLRLYEDGDRIATRELVLEAGYNSVRFEHTPESQGWRAIRADIDSPDDNILENNTFARVLRVTGERMVMVVDRGGSADPLVSALEDAGLNVSRRSLDEFPSSLSDLQAYSAVVLDDLPARGFSEQQYEVLQAYTAELGGGLITTGGLSSYGMGGYHESPFEVMLPVKSQMEEELAFPTLSLVLILDISGSMRAEVADTGLSRMDITKQAAAGVIDLLLSRERLGIVLFDHETEWLVPVEDVGDKQHLYEALGPLDAGSGGTFIYPSLVKAFEGLEDEESAARHVILMSDGISRDGDYPEILAKYQEEEITLSTISVSASADLELMSMLAEEGGGKHYFVEDIESLPQVMATEAERIAASPVVEDETGVHAVGDTRFAELADREDTPPLQGFSLTTPKDLADVYLTTDDDSPLLASWRFGLGRVVSFMSDTGQKWAEPWLDWDGYEELWGSIVNWAVTDIETSGVQPRLMYQEGQGEIVVDALDGDGNYINHLDLNARVLQGQEVLGEVELVQEGPGYYRAAVPLRDEGVYTAIISGSGQGEEIQEAAAVSVPYSPEYGLPPDDQGLLQSLREQTGGRELAEPSQVFAETERRYREPMDVWMYLAILALVVWIADIALRQREPLAAKKNG